MVLFISSLFYILFRIFSCFEIGSENIIKHIGRTDPDIPNNIFYNFLYRAREAGITVPIIAGIMPITSPKQLTRSAAMSGTDVPSRFRAIVDYFGTDTEAMTQAGIVYASEQIIDLIANGIRHIHVYTMNKPDVAGRIMKNLSKILWDGDHA